MRHLGCSIFRLSVPKGTYTSISPQRKLAQDAVRLRTKDDNWCFLVLGIRLRAGDKMPLGTNVERIGSQTVCPTAFTEETEGETTENFAGVVGARVVYREEASLLVRNHGKHHHGFAICTRCGFAMSEEEYGQGKMKLPKSFASHASIFSSNVHSFCWDKRTETAPVLRNRVLAARELTDMTLLEWPDAHSNLRDSVYSFGHALLLAGSTMS